MKPSYTHGVSTGPLIGATIGDWLDQIAAQFELDVDRRKGVVHAVALADQPVVDRQHHEPADESDSASGETEHSPS